jgi:hypothetical protein
VWVEGGGLQMKIRHEVTEILRNGGREIPFSFSPFEIYYNIYIS